MENDVFDRPHGKNDNEKRPNFVNSDEQIQFSCLIVKIYI